MAAGTAPGDLVAQRVAIEDERMRYVENSQDPPDDGPSQLVEMDAGLVKPKVVRLPSDPAPYAAPPREEPGPEAMPPAVIEGEFRPITDVGAPTEVPEQHQEGSSNHAADGPTDEDDDETPRGDQS